MRDSVHMMRRRRGKSAAFDELTEIGDWILADVGVARAGRERIVEDLREKLFLPANATGPAGLLSDGWSRVRSGR